MPFVWSEDLGPSTCREQVSELGARRLIFSYFYSSSDLLPDLEQFAFFMAMQCCSLDLPDLRGESSQACFVTEASAGVL